MLSFQIGNLPLLGAGVTSYILQTPITGLDTPDYRQVDYQKPGEDGGVVSSEFYGSRTITLQGKIKSDTLQGFETARQNLASACAITKDSSGFPTLTRITFTTLAGNSYFVDAVLRKPVFDYDQIRFSDFLITAFAPQPELYGAAARSSGTISRQSGGGFLWPMTWPFTWGTTSGGSGTLVNNGNMASYPTVTITGSATNPFIYNSTVGRYIQLNYTMGASDSLVIDMKQKTIMLNGTTNMLVYLVSGSQWWWLDPGNNTVQYSTGSGSDAGTLSVNWYDAFLGA